MNVDLVSLFVPSQSLVETFVRGTITYLALFVMIVLARRRAAGALSITDLLVLVLIADAAQNAMAGQYTSITDGLLLVATIVGWAFALDWLGFRFKHVRTFVHPPPLPLIDNGELLWRNMRKELVTLEELMSHLRASGVEDVADVKHAYVEGNGEVTVIPMEGGGPQKPDQAPGLAA